MPAARTSRKFNAALALLLVLGGCSASPGQSGVSISLPEQRIRASLTALAGCPSPLDRLRIAHPPMTVRESGDTLSIVIAAGDNQPPSVLRFDLDAREDQPDQPVRVTWELEAAEPQQELDLGEGRLLNPLKLRKEIDTTVRQFLQYDYQVGSSPQDADRFAPAHGAACRRFGRLADGLAVTTSTALRAELTRQRKRDALGWLFRDDYHLKTDSPDDAYWEAPDEPDLSRNYEF